MATQQQRAAIGRMNDELAGVLRCLRREARAPQMMTAGLDSILAALGAEGAAVIRGAASSVSEEPEVLHRAGMIGLPATTAGMLLWRAEVGTPALSQEPNGRPIAVSICRASNSEKIGLVLWRRRGGRAWASDDVPLVDAIGGIIWLLMDRDPVQRDLYRSIRTDPLTALLNQRSFVAEATRHMARLDRDDLPGTLMLAEVDNLENVCLLFGGRWQRPGPAPRRNAVAGAVRPTDLLARTGDAEFAVWLSGADYLTAAERAEDLCLEAPGKAAGPRQASCRR